MDALIMLTMWSGATVLLMGLFGRRRWALLGPSLRLYLALGWALVSLGSIQMLFTPLRFGSFDENALWFATSGGAIILTGALNLLNLVRRADARVIRRLCLAANVWITLVFVAVATHRGAEPFHDPVSVVMVVVAVAATEMAWADRGTAST